MMMMKALILLLCPATTRHEDVLGESVNLSRWFAVHFCISIIVDTIRFGMPLPHPPLLEPPPNPPNLTGHHATPHHTPKQKHPRGSCTIICRKTVYAEILSAFMLSQQLVQALYLGSRAHLWCCAMRFATPKMRAWQTRRLAHPWLAQSGPAGSACLFQTKGG